MVNPKEHMDLELSLDLRPGMVPAGQQDSHGRYMEVAARERLFGPAIAGSTARAETDPTSPSPARPAELTRGTLVDRYVLLGKLGAGGMGIVYTAYDPELDRKVALKLVLPGRSSAHGERARFLREAQALARLTHPNVVAVHDVGTHDEQVWIVMEFVPGQTLGAWVKERPRPWLELLRVMSDIARGIAAAHAVGLVHRDLKPENVMLGSDDRVRVMDFGLAHGRTLAAAEREFSASSIGARSDDMLAQTIPVDSMPQPEFAALAVRLTKAGSIQGTPAYMAPEQWRGEEVTAAADQFGWSVMAWELLFGERPFQGQNVVALGAAVLAGRRSAPRRDRGVPRWLRRVVERGLVADPAKRWRTMDALVTALERGRTRAWVRRMIVVLAGVVALWAGVWLADRAERLRQCEDAGAALDSTWNEAARQRMHEQMLATGASFAATSFEYAAGAFEKYVRDWSAIRRHVCVQATIDGTMHDETYTRSRSCLDERRMEFEELVELLRSVEDPRVVQYSAIAAAGLYAVEMCVDEVRLGLERPGDPSDRAVTDDIRRTLAKATVLRLSGQYTASVSAAKQAEAQASAQGASMLLPRAWIAMGEATAKIDDEVGARRLLERAFHAAASAGADEAAADAAVSLISMFSNSNAEAERLQGLPWAEQARTWLDRLGVGADDIRRVRYHVNLGRLHNHLEDYDEALLDFQYALESAERALGTTHPYTATVLHGLGLVHHWRQEYAAAAWYEQRSLEIREKTLGEAHPDTALTLVGLCGTYSLLDRHSEALVYCERSVAACEEAFGREHPYVGDALNNLAGVLIQRGEYEAALSHLKRVVDIRERAYGPEAPDLATAFNIIGRLHAARGEDLEALAQYEHALSIFAKFYGPRHDKVAATLFHRGGVYRRRGEFASAMADYERGLAICERLVYRDACLADAYRGIGASRLRGGDRGGAVAYLEQALLHSEILGAPAEDLAEARIELARALWGAPEQRARSLELAFAARDAFQKAERRWHRELNELEGWVRTLGPEATRPPPSI